VGEPVPRRLQDEIEQARLDFIRTDLGLCLTFATVAETAYSMGQREHAERTLASAEKGCSDMLRLFSRARGMTAEVEKGLQSKFKQLRERAGRSTATRLNRDHLHAGLLVLPGGTAALRLPCILCSILNRQIDRQFVTLHRTKLRVKGNGCPTRYGRVVPMPDIWDRNHAFFWVSAQMGRKMTPEHPGRQSGDGTNHQTVGLVRHIELHIRAVLNLAATAASLYTLGSRFKAESAHVEAELSYTRLLMRISRFDDTQTAWSQVGLPEVQEALRHLSNLASDILDKGTTSSPPCKKAMFYTAASR
jgi:hypothetical protein